MFRISISEFSTNRWSFFQDVLQASKRAYDGIGIWRKKVDDIGIDEAIDFLHEMQMSVSSVSWAGGFTGSDGRSHVAAVEDAIEAMEFARQVNADCLIVHPGSLNNHTDRHAMRLIKSALDTLAPIASDFGIRLALEPRFGASALNWTFLRRFEQTLELLHEYAPEEVGLVLDLYHVGNDNEVFSRLNSLRDRIALVQVADRRECIWNEDNRSVPGNGNVPIAKWLRRLADVGYDGFLELELYGYDIESIPYGDLLDQAKQGMSALAVEPRSQVLEKR